MSLSGQAEQWQQQTQNVWIDVQSEDLPELAEIGRILPLNTLAVEDIHEVGHWTHFEVYPEHLFLILRTLKNPESGSVETERVSYFLFLDKNVLLTVHRQKAPYLDVVRKEARAKGHFELEWLLYTLLDEATDTFFDYADAMQEHTDILEEQLYQSDQGINFSKQVFGYKHDLLHVRRLASNARESVQYLSRHIGNVQPQTALYLRDVSDRLNRVYDSLDSARDILSSVLDVHLNVQSNHMNQIMKTLTTVSTIFLPLTFLAGVWGMNFEHMPELKQPYGYAMAWGMMLLVALGLVWYFKKRKWW